MSTTTPETTRDSEQLAEGAGEVREQVLAAARRAKAAAKELGVATRQEKDAVLTAMAGALRRRAPEVLEANERDLGTGRQAGLSDALLERLKLTEERVAGMADGLDTLVGLPDPVGETVRGTVLPNGLDLRQVRVPLGVVGIVYEGRPNVTVDAAGLALKSGNAALLRGSSSAEHSNAALVGILRDVLAERGQPADLVELLPCHDRSSVQHLITARGLVDVVIPRGGAGLISAVVENATVPAIETGVGNCHVYVDAAADPETARRIVDNAKTRRTSVCNAAETLLLHRDIASAVLPAIAGDLLAAGVRLHVDDRTAAMLPDEHARSGSVVAAAPEDWDTEYLALDMAVGVVDGLDGALHHIAEHGTGHTEAIVSEDVSAVRRFTGRVDAAAVMVNASTAFTDGGEFGMGAEIGVSTQKLHARGPMGLPELTATKWLVWGEGHTRPAG